MKQVRFSVVSIAMLVTAILFIGCATTNQKAYQLRFVYFYGAPPQATESIDEKSGSVINATQITDLSKDEFALYPNVSSDDKNVVFNVLNIKNWSSNIVITRTDGKSGIARVTDDENRNENPYWISNDKIVFDSDRLGFMQRNIWITNRDGAGGLKQVTRGDRQFDFKPSFANNNVVFSSFTRNQYGALTGEPYIWSTKIDGGDLTQIKKGWQANLSQDGSRIVYINNKQLWVMGADGSNPTQLTSDKCAKIDPVWSPDCSQIAYSCDRAKERQFDIWIIDADGKNSTQLTTNLSFDGGPCWSNDGKYIFFHSNRGKKWNIWRITLSGGRSEIIKKNDTVARQITNATESEPAVSKQTSNNLKVPVKWRDDVSIESIEIADIIGMLKANWKLKAFISLQSDVSGTTIYNENVAKERLSAIKEIIFSAGISKDRVGGKGSVAVPRSTTEKGRVKNNQIEIELFE